MKIVYQSAAYEPHLVTGVYVRCHGRKNDGYIFRVFEAATGVGRFAGKPGHGPTIREYDCDGSQFTEAFREKCRLSKQTELLEYR